MSPTGRSLTDKVTLVTGGASGIGLAIVTKFLAEGAKVAVADISGLERLHGQENVLTVLCDVRKEEDVDRTVDSVLKKWGRLDVLVNNAGVMDYLNRVGQIDNETWEKVMGVNVNGPMYFMRRCVKIFQGQKTKGAIVNIGSVTSIRAGYGGVAYTTSKHALLGLTKNTAYMYRKEGITCNAVLPGPVPDTGIGSGLTKGLDISKLDAEGAAVVNPEPRDPDLASTPEDVADAVVFLAETKAMTGTTVQVDHGLTCS